MWAIKLLGSYLIAIYEANIPSYTDTNAGSYSSFPGHGGELGSGLRTRLQQ